ncbi:tRNA (guanine(37)-N(1))-methyltransferase [Entamoeba marina]
MKKSIEYPKTTHIKIEDFNITETVKCIEVEPSQVSKYIKLFKGSGYQRQKQKMSTPLSQTTQEIIEKEQLKLQETQIELNIDNFTVTEVMKKYIPNNITLPTSFETVGTLAHLNLHDDQMPYKNIIGEAFLIKNYPRIQTVITKLAEITNEFRTFPLEVIAGVDTTEVTVICHGVKFMLDFAECYWNTRLETEHIKIIDQMKPGEILCDAFAGVGPFAIPAALKGVKVYANDLNPAAVKYMKINASSNKAEVQCYNMDARLFLEQMVLTDKIQPNFILMNLPATAVEFLDVIPKLKLHHCLIHCYGFSALDNASDLQQRAHELMGADYPISVRIVRGRGT